MNDLNWAGKCTQYFLTSKLTVLIILGCFLVGSISIILTPREENPQILVPAAEVWIFLPGVSAMEVEKQLLTPLEGLISEMSGVDHILGTAMNSMAMVTVQFEVGEDKEKSLTKLYDKMRSSKGCFPPGSSEPIVKSIDVDDVPIVTVTLSSEVYDDFALKHLADLIIDRLRSLPSISLSFVSGGRNREILVEIDPEQLQAYGISLDQIKLMLYAGNFAGPVGKIVKGRLTKSLFIDGFFSTKEDVAHLVVGSHQGRPIYIEDIAVVKDAPPSERKAISRFAFGPADPRFGKSHDPEMPAVTIAVSKKKGVNAVFAGKDILERIERMKNNFIPSEVNVVVTRDDGKNANDTVNTLIEHLGISILIIFIVMSLFLGIKEAIIIGISVPLILALTLGTDLFVGPTINRITLLGLLVALGLMVDASIVVIENIHRHYSNPGKSDKDTATIIAVNEIANPTNLATFAVMLVFSSLILLTGMSKPFVFPITFNVPVAMLASIFLAYTVTPWAAYKWLPMEDQNDSNTHSPKTILHRLYYKIITPVIDNKKIRWITFIMIALLFACSLVQPLWQFIRPQGVGGPISPLGVGISIMSKDDKNTFCIELDMSAETPIEETDQVCREIGRLLRQEPYVTDYQIYVGSGGVIDFSGLLRGTKNKTGSNVAEIRVNLVNKHLREKTSVEIVRDLRPLIKDIQKNYPGSSTRLIEAPPGPPVPSALLAEIYGPDSEKLRLLSKMVKSEFKKTFDVVDIYDSEIEDSREFRVVVDKEKAALSGVTTAQVALTLRRLVEGEIMGVAHIKSERNPVPIRVYVPRRHKIDPELLAKIFITNQANQKIPLSELTQIIAAVKDRPIFHKDNEPVTFVGAEMHKASPLYAVLDLDKRLNGYEIVGEGKLKTANLNIDSTIPDTIDGYQLLWDGDMRLTLDVFRDLLFSLLLSLTMVFLLLVAYYRSFMLPLLAMSAIPLGIIGVFPGHWILGEPYSMSSNIGVVALAGVLVRSSLLIIDFVLDNLGKGLTLREAVIEAGSVRLRPIVLTALAIILGSLIMFKDLVFSGMAISLIFGIISSTILSVIAVPALIYVFLKKQEEHNKKSSSLISKNNKEV